MGKSLAEYYGREPGRRTLTQKFVDLPSRYSSAAEVANAAMEFIPALGTRFRTRELRDRMLLVTDKDLRMLTAAMHRLKKSGVLGWNDELKVWENNT